MSATRTRLDVLQESGVAIIVTIMVLLIVSLLGASIITLGRVDYAVSANYRSSTAALYLAESGIQATAADLRADFTANPSDNWMTRWTNTAIVQSPLTRWTNTAIVFDQSSFPDVTGEQVNGQTLAPATLSTNPFPGTPYALGDPAALGTGDYSRIIWLPPTVIGSGGGSTTEIRVRATGSDTNTASPATTTVHAVIAMSVVKPSPYENAAFLGAGESGVALDGGDVQIAGSVHLIGDGTGNTKIKFRNSSMINNYVGIDDPNEGLGTLSTKLPNLESVDFNGETIETLNAAMRIKDGQVQLGGGGSLGEPDVWRNSDKETLDGIYSDGQITPPAGDIHADTTAPYDLGDYEFPSLYDPYTDPATGAQHASFADYLDSIAYEPINGGDLILDENTNDFSWVDPYGKGSLAWHEDTGVLTIDGIVKINGQIKFGETGKDADKVLKYRGTGVLFATDKIEIHMNIYPDGRYLEDGPDADFLVDGNLGLVTATEILIISGENPNIRIIAALFAERKIGVKQLTNIAGAVVTNYLDVDGAPIVKIWHVPKLDLLAPLGMPTTESGKTISIKIKDWYQRR